MVTSFIDTKSKQLCYYLHAFWDEKLAFREIEIFFWDTLEEWSQVEYNLTLPYTQQERVFWHLLHQLHYWPEEKLRSDTFLVEELTNCISFLEGKGICPFDCIGIRP
ncbi:hypothetical protein [Alteromonas pelagimontana]